MAMYGVKIKAAAAPAKAVATRKPTPLWPKAAPKKSTSSKLYGDSK